MSLCLHLNSFVNANGKCARKELKKKNGDIQRWHSKKKMMSLNVLIGEGMEILFLINFKFFLNINFSN